MSKSREKLCDTTLDPTNNNVKKMNKADGRRLRRYVSKERGTLVTVKPFHLLLKGV